ncbi:MAG: hypothetical protein IT285_03395 [Bdellovibrionales bacterium]|nr:hypothetical protein [Bdellovibrionales bacterium]
MEKKKIIVVAAVAGVLAVGLTAYFGISAALKDDDTAEWRARDDEMTKLKELLAGLADQIKSAQGHSVCERDTDCRVVGLGATVCGKKRGFLVYSVRDAVEDKLLPLVEEFNATHARLGDLSLKPNECGVHPSPVKCVSGVCVPVK